MDLEFVTTQARRLQGLDRYPRSGPAESELVKALAEAAATEADLRDLITDTIRHQTVCPKPTQIYAFVRQSSTDTGPSLPTCRRCQDTGFTWVNGEPIACGCPRSENFDPAYERLSFPDQLRADGLPELANVVARQGEREMHPAMKYVAALSERGS